MRRKSIFALLLVSLAVSALLLLHRPKSIPPPLVLHPSKGQIYQAQQNMDGLSRALSSPHAGPRVLRISEQDLNIYLATSRSARKLLASRGVRAVQVIFGEPNRLTIRAAVRVQGHPQNVQLDGFLAPDAKLGLRYTATHAQVGRFPLLPAVVTAQATALAAHFSAQRHGRLPLIVQSVQIKGKILTLLGTAIQRPFFMPSPQKRAAFPPPALPVHR